MGESNVENRGNLTMNLRQSTAASTDYDLTGQILWPVSVLLAHYMASKRGQALAQGRKVVELGAGCGLPGLTAAHYAKEVLLTDGNESVVELLEQNCASYMKQHANPDNSSSLCSMQSRRCVSACKLVWGDIKHVHKIKHEIDVVIAADVVQWQAVVEPFLHTVKALLWDSKCPNPICVLGLVNRANSTTQQFFNFAKDLGFSCNKVDYDLYLNNGEVPDCCKVDESIEIYELEIIARTHEPILLDKTRENVIVGESYGNTLSLPF